MKGDIMIKILELIKDKTVDSTDFLNAILVSGYGASMNKIEYEYQKSRRISSIQKQYSKDLVAKRERLKKFLWKLKRDGLIKEIKGENLKFIISNDGKKKLAQLKNKLPGRNYKTENYNGTIIISFDIPEKLKRKRNWFREVVKNLGFKMIHQSFWVGKVRIPQELIFDLEAINILEYVEIFEINKTGSLKKMEKL